MPKDTGLSLFQPDDRREIVLSRMRQKLAGVSGQTAERNMRHRLAHRNRMLAWGWKGVLAALLIVANVIFLGKRDSNLFTLGVQGIPYLPSPAAALGADEKARYWAYALYDYDKLKARFGMDNRYAVNQAEAKKRLQDLLPSVGMETLGEISGYAPVAFHEVSARSRP